MLRNNIRHRLAVVMDIGHPYFRQIAYGIRRFVQDHPGCALASLRGNPFLDLDSLPQVTYDGLITLVCPMPSRIPLDKPVVNVSNNTPPDDLPAVLTDDIAVGRMAAEHLLEMGYEHFAWEGYPGPMNQFTRERIQGFTDRIREAGHEVINNTASKGSDSLDVYHTRFLEALPPRTGLFAPEDDIALHLLRLMDEQRIACPGHLGILGVNNDELRFELLGYSLSSVELDGESVGYQAAEMLVSYLKGQKPPARRVLVPPKRTHGRASTDLRRVIDPQLTPVIDFINANLDQRMSISRLSALSGLKRRAFEGRFRKVFGVSPYALIISRRMELAKDLLAGSNQQISVVSRACGYNNLSEFTKSFHERVGMSPKAFRQRYGHMGG